MRGERAFIVQSDMLTPYGRGTDACWDGLMSGDTAITKVERFSTKSFQSHSAGIVAGLGYQGGESLVLQMLRVLFDCSMPGIPEDARIILATTKGEVDLLEAAVLAGEGDAGESMPTRLLSRARTLAGVKDGGTVISAACVSSTAALARAASMIRQGDADCVLVVACDSVTEFVFSGFSTFMALDTVPARPFDRDRAGLSVGEAAAYALVMGGSRAIREGRKVGGEIAGWGLSADANHMTGPSRDGSGQARAIVKALEKAGLGPEEIGSVSAHGTGTRYNDSMEMKAFSRIFGKKIPVYSIKGGIGHTMGAAGIIEALLAAKSVREGVAPPTLNLAHVDDESAGWVFPEARRFGAGRPVLSTNSGFGGVNAALAIGPGPAAAA